MQLKPNSSSFAHQCQTENLIFRSVLDLGTEYPVSDLLHDVQWFSSDQRSLRHGACSEQQQTRASWRQIRVRGLRPEVYKERPLENTPVNGSWCWWRQDLPVWRLLSGVQRERRSYQTLKHSACHWWRQDLPLWRLLAGVQGEIESRSSHEHLSQVRRCARVYKRQSLLKRHI